MLGLAGGLLGVGLGVAGALLIPHCSSTPSRLARRGRRADRHRHRPSASCSASTPPPGPPGWPPSTPSGANERHRADPNWLAVRVADPSVSRNLAPHPFEGHVMSHVMSSVPPSVSRPTNRGRWARSIAVAGLTVSLAAGAVACGGSSVAGATWLPKRVPVRLTSAPGTNQGTARRGARGGRNGTNGFGGIRPAAFGTIAAASPGMFEVQSTTSQTTVNYSATTAISQTKTVDISAVTVGSCVLATAGGPPGAGRSRVRRRDRPARPRAHRTDDRRATAAPTTAAPSSSGTSTSGLPQPPCGSARRSTVLAPVCSVAAPADGSLRAVPVEGERARRSQPGRNHRGRQRPAVRAAPEASVAGSRSGR